MCFWLPTPVCLLQVPHGTRTGGENKTSTLRAFLKLSLVASGVKNPLTRALGCSPSLVPGWWGQRGARNAGLAQLLLIPPSPLEPLGAAPAGCRSHVGLLVLVVQGSVQSQARITRAHTPRGFIQVCIIPSLCKKHQPVQKKKHI